MLRRSKWLLHHAAAAQMAEHIHKVLVTSEGGGWAGRVPVSVIVIIPTWESMRGWSAHPPTIPNQHQLGCHAPRGLHGNPTP